MDDLVELSFKKRKTRSPKPLDEPSISPDLKKTKQYTSPGKESDQDEGETPTVSTVIDSTMSQEFGATLQEILKKLEKLDVIQSSLGKIESKIATLETRTQELETFQDTTKKDIEELKSSQTFIGEQAKQNADALKKDKVLIAGLLEQAQKNEDMINELQTKNLYLEAYSRRENLKFMNIKEETTIDEKEDTEEVLRSFLERDLGFADARNVEIQRVHRNGKSKDGKPRPILARFLRFKDVQKIISLGHRLKDTDYQIFQDYPAEIINRRRSQMESFKAARKKGIPASFSSSQPDKLYIRGKLWPEGKIFFTS